MAGYHGYSMSNNAVSAYEAGEKPISKWTKKAIVEEAERAGFPAEAMEAVKKRTDLKSFLKRSSWHHTSARYNRTDFYMVDTDRLLSAVGYREALQVQTKDGWKTGDWTDPKPEGMGYLSFLSDDGIKYPDDEIGERRFIYVRREVK